jgi:putative ABC transport system permease protein
VTRAVLDADPSAEVSNVQMTDQVIGELLYPRRVAAGVLATAGGIGLLLSVIGLYGLVSYSVARRQQEIGIRATLGASPGDLVRLVLRDGARVLAIGGSAGVVVAMLAVGLTTRLLPGLPRVDLLSSIAVPSALAVVIFVACYVPARRAGRVDPIEVLRSS